jgi:hypothetical protein
MSKKQDEGLDFRDMMLECIAEVKETFRETMIDLTRPIANLELQMLWAKLPPQLKDKLRTDRPEEYEMLMKQINGG